ncbi:MAG: AGE family epimerase/isomerase [Ginsengibacter sp.]
MFTHNDIKSAASLWQYKSELEHELSAILNFWQQHTIDQELGGFYGRLDNVNKVDHHAPKSSVVNSRILWAFSAAYNLTGNKDYLKTSERAFQYIVDNFIDKKYGGVYWSVDYKGKPADTKKQIYALSFAIYGLSEFYQCSGNHQAKELALALYNDIMTYSHDEMFGGYIEALSEDWKELRELRLSEKDANEKKTMNTHLHVLEGFSNLYRIWPNEVLKKRITELIHVFLNHIIDDTTNHLILFFNEKWNVRSNVISYGHDIEAAWLIRESVEVIGDKELLEKIKMKSVLMADAAAEGLGNDGGLWYEYDTAEHLLLKEKHWWPQAESMIGFFNAWQINGDEGYLQKSIKCWNFVKDHIRDQANGEWFWGVTENYSLMAEDKVGFWKGPYHNSRACIELIRRINSLDCI